MHGAVAAAVVVRSSLAASARVPSLGRRPRRWPTPSSQRSSVPVTLLRAGDRAFAPRSSSPPTTTGRVPCPVLARPLRRARTRNGSSAPLRLPHLAVVRRPGLRGRRRRRPRHPGPGPRLGARRRISTWPARCSKTRSRRSTPRPSSIRARPARVGHPGLELRGLPRRAGRAPPARRLPRRRRRRTGHGLAPLRHPLHRALPRRPGDRARGLRAHVARGRRRPASRPTAAARPRPGRRQRGGGPHPPAVVGPPRRRPAPPGAAAVRGDPHDAAGGGGREPPAPAAGLPAGALGISP